MKSQFFYFVQDVKRMIGKRKVRLFFIWTSRSFAGIFLYRLEKGLSLTFGKSYDVIRILLLPIRVLIQAYSNIDIHYKADIKGGLMVLHPSIGIVISNVSVIGSNFTLTGGNVVGVNKKCAHGELIIGDNCTLGANAVILGPLILADFIKVGALACVTKDCLESRVSLIGVPAKIKVNE